jgi:hypothetical protein
VPGIRRQLGFLTVLPLYVAMAMSIGFVDHHVRPFGDHAYTKYVPEVIAGTAAPPARYRVLAPFIYTQMVRLTGLTPDDGWVLFRWLCLVGAFAAGHLLYRSWFSTGAAVAGNAVVAVLLPLTFTNGWGHPDHFMELLLFTLGCACAARGWVWPFLAVLVLNGLNRETSFLLVMVFMGAEALTRRRLGWIAAAVGVWVAVYAGLRWRLGFVPYNPLHVRENLNFLLSWPAFAADRDLYSRLYPWFFVALLGAPVAAIARTWSAQPRFVRLAVGVATPVFVIIGVTFSSVMEPRILTPLLPLLVTGLLFAFFAPAASAEAESRC